MTDFTPVIHCFCCHYTSQQSVADGQQGLVREGFPDNVIVHRVPCSGKIQVSTLLKAFEDGADGVYVVGCPLNECHNLMGSQRAAKRVLAIKKALGELGCEEERVAMYHLQRGFHPEFIDAGREMDRILRKFGPCPLKGDSQ